jgi:sulfide:quinone oxidoreductase
MGIHVAIIGGGVGGTVVANRLRHHIGSQSKVRISVFDEKGLHVYQPNWLYLPFNSRNPDFITRKEENLLSRKVDLITGEAGKIIGIDLANHRLTSANGSTHDYDYLILALGARNVPDDVPGFAEGSDHFYSEEAALQLRHKLQHFQGGKIIVGVSTLPYRCPPAPLEFTFLVEDYLRRRGLREKSEIHYVYPINRPFPMQSVSDLVSPLLEKRGVEVHTFFNVESIDPQKKMLASMEGEELLYDLLVLAPPHRGTPLAQTIGIGDSEGWIPTDRNTLHVKGHEAENVFALGDCTDLPISKSGSAAHYEAHIIADTLIAAINNKPLKKQYTGHVSCFLETGYGQASFLDFDYEHPPKPPAPGRMWHYAKGALNTFYWNVVPPGRL